MGKIREASEKAKGREYKPMERYANYETSEEHLGES